MTVPGQRRESSVNSFATAWGGLLVCVCVFRQSFSVQAVAARCENYDLDLDLDSFAHLSGG